MKSPTGGPQDIERVITKYIDVIRSDVFTSYEKEFSQKVSSGLAKGYLQNLPEPSLVRIVKNVVNSVNGLIARDNKTYFEVSTKSIFIHGNRSKVEFDFHGRSIKRELGDLIFIITVVFNGQKYFEKLTINQFKKDNIRSKILSWNISNKGQLYLLSRFPTFRGVRGSIIPMKEYSLPNLSGCLGSYGLLYGPGDFVFASAIELDFILGHKNILKKNEIHNLANRTKEYSIPYLPYFCLDLKELIYFSSNNLFWWILPWNRNYQYACNLFDFAHKYLTVGIGEPIFMKMGPDNPQARNFLHDLLSAANTKAKREKIRDVSDFVYDFFKFGYASEGGQGSPREGIDFDLEAGEIGIIHTTINLGTSQHLF